VHVQKIAPLQPSLSVQEWAELMPLLLASSLDVSQAAAVLTLILEINVVNDLDSPAEVQAAA
jgi:hypothetical protein